MTQTDERRNVFFSYDSGDFAEIMKAARKARGWTQVELAGIAGVNAETINRIERGMNTRISTMTKIRKVLPDMAGSNGQMLSAQHVEAQRQAVEQEKQKADLEALRDQVIHLIRAIGEPEQLERIRHYTLRQLTAVDVLRTKLTPVKKSRRQHR